MHRKLALALLTTLSACSSIESTYMSDTMLKIQVTCDDNPQCTFVGNDMPISIRISNTHDRPVGFPLAFRQKTGPYILLIDTATQAQKQLKTNLASLDLREQFTTIEPGQSVSLSWMISCNELKQFAGLRVDVTAQINITADVLVDDQKIPSQSVAKIHILGKNN
jgi:hypothetical protein